MRNNKDNSEKGYWVVWVCWCEHQSWRRSNSLEAELSQDDAPPPPSHCTSHRGEESLPSRWLPMFMRTERGRGHSLKRIQGVLLVIDGVRKGQRDHIGTQAWKIKEILGVASSYIYTYLHYLQTFTSLEKHNV